MKLTKIESYEIQAFAFHVMTGYMAPGKDVSPLACEAPYEERCAAWEEWRNKHAHCILAMLHGFEALIDRNDEPTRALLARLDERDAEVERLRGELDDCINVLPNTAYYLDPPDGGSVTIAEQLRRMGEDAARYRWLRGGPAHYECALAEVERLRDDAERYRWLRRKCAATGRAAVRERSGGDAAVSGRRQDGLQGADLTSSPA
ncbi:MAG: hypothetical protein IT298_14865 [Chloroflexi bacterium]|nr:hypothetical protein [Chloroflexota bacterium]